RHRTQKERSGMVGTQVIEVRDERNVDIGLHDQRGGEVFLQRSPDGVFPLRLRDDDGEFFAGHRWIVRLSLSRCGDRSSAADGHFLSPCQFNCPLSSRCVSSQPRSSSSTYCRASSNGEWVRNSYSQPFP